MQITETTQGIAAAPAARRGRRDRFLDHLGAYGFLLPNILGFFAFTLGPALASLLLSFCRWDLISGLQGIHWVGLSNYREIAGDHEFWHYVTNTLILMLGIPFAIIGSLL